jgi:acetylornithine deacetylase/succinyl-diaminopimelate desuccinylase-like protein
VLIYGHYDVQPADQAEAWRSPPFVAEVRGDRLYGRGASDDKGQLLCHVEAIERLLRIRGRLPVNVVCLFEGEEEIGSPNLGGVVTRSRSVLDADVVVASDTRMIGPGRPALTYALRGSLAMEVEISGPAADLHSGVYGGAVHNPLQALCELVSSFHDRQGRVLVPGFYDGRRRLSAAERAELRRAGPTDSEFLRRAGTALPWGAFGKTLYERTTIWPALTINGLSGGYQGAGGMSVIPASAAAKVSARLVADQDPRETAEAIARHVARHTAPGIRAKVTVTYAAEPVVLDRHSAAMSAGAAAYRHSFGVPPVFRRSGGTIPAVAIFRQLLGLDTVLLGFGLPDDRIHAPDESIHLPTFGRGIVAAGRFLDEVCNRDRSRPSDQAGTSPEIFDGSRGRGKAAGRRPRVGTGPTRLR